MRLGSNGLISMPNTAPFSVMPEMIIRAFFQSNSCTQRLSGDNTDGGIVNEEKRKEIYRVRERGGSGGETNEERRGGERE